MTLKQGSPFGKELSEFDRALVVGSYFGFRPIMAPKITKNDLELTRNCGDHPYYDASEKMAVMRTYVEANPLTAINPTALIYERPVSRKKFGSHALHFIGTQSGIAEATLIRATLSILSEEGYKNLRVDVNCIGDRESINTYERELTNYVRKSNAELSEEFRRNIKEDIFNLFKLNVPEAIRLAETAPSSITFLSSQSRAYFKEVLEYIEALGIEFRLTNKLVGERNHSSHTIFAVKNIDNEDEGALAVGYRYSRLGRYLGLRKEVPMAGVNIFSASPKDIKKRIYKSLPKPKFYLIQLGREAKIKTLSLIELLRSHRIPLYHFLGRDKITVQLSNAESLRVPYLIIIGQKEALENTATIRNMSTRAQDTVSIERLPQYLRDISL